MAETETLLRLRLPKEASALEASVRHSITEWKSDLWSLKRSMSKAGAKGAGAPEPPGLLVLAEEAARRDPEWPRTGEDRCRSHPGMYDALPGGPRLSRR